MGPKDCAIQFYKKKCIDYLEQIEFDKDHPESAENLAFPAHVAALNGDLDHLKMLIEQGIVSLNERDDKGATPAHKAAGNGHLRCLQWLTEMGADFNIKNSAEETPLDVAKRFAQLACIRFLGGDEEDELAPVEAGKISPRDPGTGDIDILHMSEVQKREAKGRALRKVDELSRSLTIAKENYKQLGGELDEDKIQSELLQESERVISDLNGQLEYERIRREKLEVQLDELRLENSRLRDEIDAINAANQDISSEADMKEKKKNKKKSSSFKTGKSHRDPCQWTRGRVESSSGNPWDPNRLPCD